MSYAFGTKGYIPNLKGWDKDLYKDYGPDRKIRYKVNKDDSQWLSERQISEMKSDFLNKAQAEYTDKQYWKDIRFDDSVRGTLSNIRDIFKPNPLNKGFKGVGEHVTRLPNMDVPEWMGSDENYSKFINKKSGHFHSLLHQKQALNQYDIQRDEVAAQAKIDQGVVDRDKLLEANRIENAAVIAELNKPVSTGNVDVNSTQALKQKAEGEDAPGSDAERNKALGYNTSLAGNEAVYDSKTGTMQIPDQNELNKQANERLKQEQITPDDPNKGQTKQTDPDAAMKTFDKVAGFVHGAAQIAQALESGKVSPVRTPLSWKKGETAKIPDEEIIDDTAPDLGRISSIASIWDPDKKKNPNWRMIS